MITKLTVAIVAVVIVSFLGAICVEQPTAFGTMSVPSAFVVLLASGASTIPWIGGRGFGVIATSTSSSYS